MDDRRNTDIRRETEDRKGLPSVLPFASSVLPFAVIQACFHAVAIIYAATSTRLMTGGNLIDMVQSAVVV